MAEERIAELTAEALDARDAGDTETMERAFAARDDVASGASVPQEAMSADDAAEILSASSDGVEFLGPTLGDDLQQAYAYAEQAEDEHPELAAAIGKLAEEHPELHAQVLAFLIQQGRRMASETTKGRTMSDGKSTPRGRQGIQDRIDEIYQQHPIGSESYKSSRVQRELAELHTRLHGDETIVGGRDKEFLRTA